MRFCVVSDCSRFTSVFWISEISFSFVFVFIILNNRFFNSVFVIMEFSLVSFFVRVKVWLLIFFVLRVINCRRYFIVVRRRRRWELVKVVCNII